MAKRQTQIRFGVFNEAVRGFMFRKKLSMEEFGAGLAVSRSTVDRRLKDPDTFTVAELRKLLDRTKDSGDDVKDAIIQLIWG